MKNLIDQLNELEEQLRFIQNRLIQLSLFDDAESASLPKSPRELRNSVNIFLQSQNPQYQKIHTQFRELYYKKKKKFTNGGESPVESSPLFMELSGVLRKLNSIL